MTLSQERAIVEKYRNQLKPGDTPASFSKRVGLALTFARKVFSAFRKHGILPTSSHAKKIPNQMQGLVGPDEPDLTPPTVEEGDGVAHAWSVDTKIRTPEELISAADLDLNTWEVVKSKVNSWPVAMKNPDTGEAVVTRLWQVSLDLRPRLVPLAPLVEWAPPPPYYREPRVGADDTRRALILPDAQIGYRWVLDGSHAYLEPHHDRAAIDLACQMITETEPTDIVLLGDMLDFAPLSTRWPVEDAQRQVTRLALQEWRWLLQRIKELAGNARIVYLEGNHEERWTKYLKERAGELVSVVPTLPALLDLDALGVEWVPYRSQAWLWDRVRLIHGEVVRAGGGSTAAAVLAKETHSAVYGHIHRAEMAHRRVTGPQGDGYLWAMSPGCLCRVDGDVPGSTPRTDWQQGVGEIVSAPGLEDSVSVVRISKGRALYRGKIFEGKDYTESLVETSGVTMYRRAA